MKKPFDKWSFIKQRIDKKIFHHYFSQQEIWLVRIGLNIGVEINGKGNDFCRPVLVYRKFNRFQFLGIPLTSQNKSGKYYFLLKNKSVMEKSFLVLSQIRIMDQKRMIRKLGKVSDFEFDCIKKSAQAVLEPQSPNGYNLD